MNLTIALILLVLIILVIIFQRNVKGVIYLIGTTEVFFQLMHYFKDNIEISEIESLVSKYIPSSLFNVLGSFTDGVIYTVLSWGLFIIFFWFFIYLVKYLFNVK